jgi:hypothetical protein
MTVAFGALGAKSAGGTSTLSITHPSSVGAGDMLIAGRATWRSTSECDPSDESGWTNSGELSGGTGTAADNHTSIARADRKIAAGGETGSVTFDQTGTPGTTGGGVGIMARYTKASTATWEVATATGTDNTHGTNRSASSSAGINFRAGDRIIAIVATDTDTSLAGFGGTFNFSASNVTFATPDRRTSGAGVTTGNDGNIEIIDAEVTASTNTGTPIVTLNFGTSTSQCGPVVFIRLREAALEIQGADQAQRASISTLGPGVIRTGAEQGLDWDRVEINGSGNLVLNRPLNAVQDTFLLVEVGDTSASTLGLPSGWAWRTGPTTNGAVVWGVAWKKMGGSEPSSYTFTRTGTSRATLLAQTYVFQDLTTPFDLASPETGSSSSGTTVVGSITTQTDFAMMIGGAVADFATAGSITVPLTMTEIAQATGTGRRATISDEKRGTAGGSTSRTWTHDAGSLLMVAWVDALRSAGGEVDLVVANAAQAQTSQNLALTQVHALAVAGAAQAQTAQNLALTQVHVLTVQAASQAQTADNTAVLPVLGVQAASQAQTAQNVVLTQVHALAVQAASQAQTAQQVALVVDLAIAAASQAQTAGNVTLTQVHALAVQGATQAQTAQQLTLTQVHQLAVQGATQAQTVQSLALAQTHALVIASATHGQSAGSLALTQTHVLAIQPASQTQHTGPLTLGAATLAIQAAFQAQTAQALTLSQVHLLAVAQALQAAQSGNVVLTEVPTLQPANATQAQLAAILALSQVHALGVDSSMHGHTAAEIALFLGSLPLVRQVGGGVVYRMGGGDLPLPATGAITGQGGSGGEPLRQGTGAILTKG